MTKPTRAQLNRIQTQQERAMLQAFNAIIADIRDQAVLSEIVRALEVGNVDAVIRLTGIDEATWSPLADQIRESYRQGGITGAAQLGRVPVEGGTTIARFNMRAPAAEAWVATESSKRVVEIVAEQRKIIRDTLTDAIARGQGPRDTALDLVGRIDPRTRRRVGGIVGLTEQQAGWVRNARRELEELDPNYLTRALRDRRLDGAVARAIRDGKPLTQTQIDRAITQMQARAQRYRGEVIARTESINALREGQAQSIAQALGKSEIDPRDATKVWDATGDSRTRPSHADADGQSVPVDQPFRVGGYQMMHPGDSSMGAPAAEVINCYLPDTKIQVSRLKSAIRREYFGQVVNICAGSGVNLTVTPNHPILTQRGWVAACDVVEGDKIIQAMFIGERAAVEPDVSDAVTTAQELYSSAHSLGRAKRADLVGVNLHGEVPAQDVDVVTLDSSLRNRFDSPVAEFCNQFSLAETDVLLGDSLYSRILQASSVCHPGSPDGSVCGGSACPPFIRRSQRRALDVALRYCWSLNTKVIHTAIDLCAATLKLLGYPINGKPLIKESANLLRKRSSSRTISFGIFCSDDSGGLLRANGGDTHVGKAAFNNSDGCSSLFGDSADREIGYGLNKREQALSLLCPMVDLSAARVTSVIFSHYSGPVFNFETSSGLIISDNAITHNCRCTVRYEIDYLGRAARIEGFG